ncbi:hypothetical protein [Paludisphaera rhizosphaerae]|uniref:hypothetical protein n=1 Tax=Paludisphaera rhizosphaerae TaxID=2711216 RepID=UPI0013EA5C2B|nr:hypothetical protein [Paludisphaera rhizosphaerae]
MRVRITLRRSMALVALAALSLFAYEEFQDGVPPRFIVRSIPDRFARLRPDMTYEQVEEILGLEKSWLRGGLSASNWIGIGNGPFLFASYQIGLQQPTTPPGMGAGPVLANGTRLSIDLSFISNAKAGEDWRRSKSTRLINAGFRVDGKLVAHMGK